MARRGRPPKNEAEKEPKHETEINMGEVRVIVRDMYNCTQLGRSECDHGGQDYAYQLGYLTKSIFDLMDELNMRR